MKHLTKWILALVAVACVAGFSGAWSPPAWPASQAGQDAQAKRANPVQAQGKQAQGKQGKGKKVKGRAERQAALKKSLPLMKTSLAEAIALAEKESTGKAFGAEVQFNKDGKPILAVELLANDKFTSATVDPETKKVTMAPPEGQQPATPAGGDEDGDGEGDEEGEDEDGG